MTRQEYEAKLADLQSQIEELKQTEIEEDIPKPPHPRWKPGDDDIYYVVLGIGFFTQHIWSKSDFDYERYDIGNVFKSFKEAEFAIERLKVLAEMREWEGHNYDGTYIYYHKPSDEIMIDWDGDSTNCYGDIRFKCVDDAENCVKAVGKERIKKYYFRIPDNEEGEKTDDRE